MRRCVRSATLAILAVCIGCQGPTMTGPGEPASDDAIARLHTLARAEAENPPPPPADMALPPGVDPDALRRRDTPESRMTLAEVFPIHRLPDPVAPAGIDTPDEVNPESRRLALYHYTRARQAALEGKHLVAITELQKSLEQDRESIHVIRELARSYAALGSMSRSLGLFIEVLRREPGDSEALLTIAMSSLDRREFESAIGALAVMSELNDGRLRFEHDPGGEGVAWFVLFNALTHLGYDTAALEAAHQVIAVSTVFPGGTIYRQRLEVIYRQRGEIWRSMGDGYCRLGDYAAAMEAYAQAAMLPAPDPGALNPRVIYASLARGRRAAAQVELLEALRLDRVRISDREISLCRYMAEHAPPVTLLGESVCGLYEQQRDRADLVRAAAALLPRDEAQTLLREFLERAPGDVAVASQLLAWLGDDDLAAAVTLTASLAAAHPELARAYTAHLVAGPPTFTALLETVRGLPPSAEHAALETRLLLLADSPGLAWDRVREALAQWPRDHGLLELQIDTAAALGEASLVDEAVRAAGGVDTESMYLAEARAWLALNRAERAAAVVESYEFRRGNASYDALLLLARANAAYALASANEAEVARRGPAVISTAERAIALDPTRDDAYAVLFDVYQLGSPLENADALRSLARRLLERAPESRLYARLAARESIGQGRFEQALDRLLNLYQSDPTDRESLGLAVTAWVQMDRMNDARLWLDEQLEQRPADTLLLEQWSAVLTHRKEAEELVDGLFAAWEVDPDNGAISSLLEQALSEVDRVAESLELGEKRLMRRPPGVRRALGLAAVYARGEQTSAAVEQLRSIRDLGGEGHGLDYFLSALTVAGTLDPEDPERQQVTLDLAMDAIDRYPGEAPLQVYGSAMLAMARLGQLDERFDELARRAVLEAPRAGEGTLTAAMQWRHLAQMMVDNDHPEAAARAIRARLYAVARLEPEAHSLLTMAALASDAAAGGRVLETLQLLTDLESRGLLPRVEGASQPMPLIDALFEVSTIYSIIGDEEGAGVLLRAVLEQDALHAMALNNLGYLLLETEGSDIEEVEGFIDRAFELEPEDSNIIDTLGWLRYKQGRLADEPVEDTPLPMPGAISLIEEAIDRSETPSGEVFDHLGDAMYRAGDVQAARTAWTRAAAILEDPATQQQTLRILLLIQRGWGLMLADPRSLYDRDDGAVLKRVRAKINALDVGDEPAVAPTFAESNRGVE